MATKKTAAKKTAVRKTPAKKAKVRMQDTVAKAPAKRAYNRKKTAAKTSPLKGRKYGPRKPKNVVEEAVVQAAEINALAEDLSAQADQAVQEDVLEEQDQFLNIEIVDLRGLDVVSKFAVVVALSGRGYIADDTSDLLDIDNLVAIYGADALRLQHRNRLVSPTSVSDISASAAVSRVEVSMQARVDFSDPTPMVPTTLEMHGATYLRIG